MRLLEVDRRRLPAAAGRKALGLRWLARHGFATPRTWVIPWAPAAPSREGLREALSPVIDPTQAYAVRSSSSAEDAPEHSFAGLFETVLDVRGVDGVVSAVERVMASAEAPVVADYLDRTHATDRIRMAVIVQEMIPPVVSGVVFSTDPLTGLERVVIEAVSGDGLALMSGEKTPLRWVRRHARWRVLAETEDVPLDLVAEVADGVEQMARRYKAPVDAEWVWDGERLFWLQVRPVTTGSGTVYYSNRIARDMLPGLITPLVWSVNIPIVCGAWIRLLDEALGPTGLAPDDLARQYYYRAYFNMGTFGDLLDRIGFPRDTLEDLTGVDEAPPGRPVMKPTLRTLAATPRMLAFASGFMGFERKAERDLAAYRLRIAEFLPCRDDLALTADETLERIDRLAGLTQEIARLNILTPLMAAMFARRLRRRLEPHGIAYDRLVFPEDDTQRAANPGTGFARLHSLFSVLPEDTQAAVRAGELESLGGEPGGNEFLRGVDEFLEHYGHFSAMGTDIASVPWREDQPAVLRMAAAYVPPAVSDDRIDRAALAASGVPARVVSAYDRVARLHSLRDRLSSLYILAYGLLRPLYRHLAAILTERGVLVAVDDAFLLADAEIRAALAGDLDGAEVRRLVVERRRDMDVARAVEVPAVVFGDDVPAVAHLSGQRLLGLASSGGVHVGPVRKIDQPGSPDRVNSGDVLVVPYSDLSWMPLVARAGAVVSEGGGYLSHSAIIAREYGIPAVVSCDGAMSRLAEGALVSVDGFAGTVTSLDGPAGAPEGSAA